jgi:glycyl-tRNA synthetase beta chain
MEGELPGTPVGKILSLADRLDTIVAFLAAGLFPTGSEDPFALRRQATAIIRILFEGGLPLDLTVAIEKARGLLEKQGFDVLWASQYVSKHAVDPVPFIADRIRHYGRTVLGLRDDLLEAVLAPPLEKERKREARSFEVVDLIAKMKALQDVAIRPEFDPLMVGFKRAHRMVEKEQWRQAGIDAARLQHPSEVQLHKELLDAQQRVPGLLADGDYAGTLEALIGLKPAIDGFFAGVMVNAEDAALRANRLSLLSAVDRLFMVFADFSRIMVQGS